MNERIRELAEQAHLSWCIENDFDRVNLQEFAELLEKEYTKDCRDMFIVGSVSWNLLNEKLQAIGVE